ncbi:MAG: translation initiation factor IF-2 [Planctomycetota bacterium]
MPKKRVYDLAKEYGMSGQELAQKLRDLGFQVKSHMSALDDFKVLEIQARLEAYGIVGTQAVEEPSGSSVGGLKIKRKKKKPTAAEPPSDDEASATTPAPEQPEPQAQEPATPQAEAQPSAEPEPSAPAPPERAPTAETEQPSAAQPVEEQSTEAQSTEAQSTEAQPAAGQPAAEQPTAAQPAAGQPTEAQPTAAQPTAAQPTAAQPTAAQRPAAHAEGQGPEATAPAAERKAPADEPAAKERPSDPSPAAADRAEAPAADASGTKPAAAEGAAAADAPARPSQPGAAQPTAKPADDAASKDLVRPSTKRRAGKVVGFIDPAQFAQSTAKKRPDSRRLRSRDDVVPDVRPTFGRDPNSLVRGDSTRGALTAQELRDREAGRFLRRRRPQHTGGGGRRGGGRGRGSAPSVSPHADSTVTIDAPVTLKKLANELAVTQAQVLTVAIRQVGFGVNINTLLDEDTAVLLASEFDVDLLVKQEIAAEEHLLARLEKARDDIEDQHLVQRPPTVAFLGHVDHGKTTLIDAVRASRLATGEAGGITQHIGAYQVETKSGHKITIVDTPGHAAFTQMRARGANAVDVVVLVVAADDGVKPQTEEALNHAKAAGTPVVVALNKMDKAEANPERVQNELAGLGLTPEEWGGDTAMMKVSALTGDGVDDLLERVFLESEVLELRSHAEGPASGVVLEAEIQQGKGKVAHLLVQDGNLKRGDVILAGTGYGKVRAIHDDRGNQVKNAGPSRPVEVTGLNELPTVGDKFHVVDTLDEAQEVAEERARTNRMNSQIERRTVGAHNLLEAVADQDRSRINLIVKADVQGSIEVLKQQLEDLSHDEVLVKLVHSGVGQILESDVDLAVTSDARILAFHTSAAAKIRQKAERENVELRIYTVIYELLDDVRRLMEGELSPEVSEEVTGHAEIRRIFKSSKIGNIAGCYVLDGKIRRSDKIRLLRDGNVVYTGAIGTLRRENDDVKEVRSDFECGIVLHNYNDVQLGDVIETYKLVETKRTL